MSATKTNTSLQQKLEALEADVRWFEGDDFALEQAVEKFKQLEGKAKDIEADLKALKNEITVLQQSFQNES
jgi:exonuclease VII small subunit